MTDHTLRCRRLLVILCLLGGFAVAGCGSAVRVSGSQARVKLGAGTNHFTVRTADGRVRSYIVYAPARGATPRPLVLVFHGADGTAEQTAQETDFVQAASQDGLIVAFLQGFQDTWNEGAGDTPARAAHVNDVEFTAAALAQIEHSYPIDRTRIAASGFSNGALLTQLLGCQLADQLTLIAPVEGQLPVSVAPSCRPSRSISVLEVHATGDQSIPYAGGHFNGIGGGTTVLSAPASAARWASLNGCTRVRRTLERTQAIVITTYAPCHDHVVVQLRTIEGASHSWPADIGVLLADFLQRHPRAVGTG